MTVLDNILSIPLEQKEMTDLLTEIETENESGGFDPGQTVTHVDYPSFRAIVLKPDSRPDKMLVKVLSGWRGEHIPVWPVSVPIQKLRIPEV